MAIVHITTTHGAIPLDDQAPLSAELASLTYAAEGFAGSSLAPPLTWAFFDERPRHAVSTGAGAPQAALYYVVVTTFVGAMDRAGKQTLGASLAAAILAKEGSAPTPENLNRIWVRFLDTTEGDFVVGGETASLDGLRTLIAQAA